MENMGLKEQFWSGKRVLITGHTGFKGAWLTYWLLSLGSIVKGISLDPVTDPNLYEALDLKQEMESKIGDIRNLEFLKKEISEFKPEIILHLAAQAIVRESYEQPVETFQINVIGTANILEAARNIDSLKAILCVTSDKCYENREWPWNYREDDAMGGWDPYSASKGCSELIISSFKKSYYNEESYSQHGVSVASARAGNVIGGGDWSRDRLIPDIVRSYSSGKPVMIRNPYAIRPWQHVLDLLNGYMLLVENMYHAGAEFGEAWNFGPLNSENRKVIDIVDRMTTSWGGDASYEYDRSIHPHEASTLKLDSSKAQTRLKWNPILSLDDSLDWVIDWYKGFYSNEEHSRSLTTRQIDFFENALNLKAAEKAIVLQ